MMDDLLTQHRSVRISSGTSFLSLTFIEAVSELIILSVEVHCYGFRGRNGEVWFTRAETDRFLADLEKFEATRRGMVILSCLSGRSEHNEFYLQLFATDRAGHLAVKVEVLDFYYLNNGELCPLKVSVGFDVDPEYLIQIVSDFKALFRGQANNLSGQRP